MKGLSNFLQKFARQSTPSKPQQLSELQPGQLLIDRYRLLELIGSGSMGSVFRADDELFGGVMVAVKFLCHNLLCEEIAQQFAWEARTGALLGHQSRHIVRVLDYGLHEQQIPFYVMEYMEGCNLDQLIQQQPLNPQRFLHLMSQVCLGLQLAHQGITIEGQLYQVVHRDIKPSNIFVTQDPSLGELAKLLDFGIAAFSSHHTEQQQSKSLVGTLAYGAPEQIAGQSSGIHSDIYSLGITMFETLTGQLPILGQTNTIDSWSQAHSEQAPRRFSAVAPHLTIPAGLEKLVMSCLEKAPENRPQSVEQILTMLRDLTPQGSAYLPRSAASAQTSTASGTIHAKSGANQPTIISQPQQSFWTIEDAAWHTAWPADKPIAEIVFAQTLQASEKEAAALWAMLPQQEIQKRLLNDRHSHFLCTLVPHPMMLWITTIYDKHLGPRWLPCYMDLKSSQGKKMLQLLSTKGYYLLMLFGIEDPSRPVNVATLTIPAKQRQLLSQWLKTAPNKVSSGNPGASKKLLKQEYKRVTAKIIEMAM